MAGIDVETCFVEYQINLLEGHNRENFAFYQKFQYFYFIFHQHWDCSKKECAKMSCASER